MEEKKFERIRVLIKQVSKTDEHEAFASYKLVGDGGRLLDLRMCRTVDTRIFDGLRKFEIDAIVEDASDRYEYPRAYCKEVKPETLVKLA